MPPRCLADAAVVRLRTLRDSRDGGVAMMFGLLLLPTLAVVGVGVDMARAYSAKLRFEAAFDNAASVLRTSPASDSAQTLHARMQSYLDMANPAAARGDHVALRMSDPLNRVVVVTANTAVPTVLMQLAGVRSLPLSAAAKIVRQHPAASEVGPAPGAGDDSGEEPRRGGRPREWHGLWLRQDF